MLLLYLGIYLVLGMIFGYSAKTEDSEGYVSARYPIAVIDRDHTPFSQGLTRYMGIYHDLVEVPDDPKRLSEELYYSNILYVITIPEGAWEDIQEGEGFIETTAGTYMQAGWYVEAKVNEYAGFVKTYVQSGYSQEEAVERAMALSEKEAAVSFGEERRKSENESGIGFSFRYVPYVMIASLSFILGYLLQEYQQTDLKRRLRVSAMPLWRQNVEALLASLIMGVVVFFLCLGLGFIFSPEEMIKNKNLGYFAGNLFVFMLVSLAMAFCFGVITKSREALNGVVNVVSLGMCFLGGVFVPVSFLGGSLRKVSMFLPTYWYENNNTLLDQYTVLSDSVKARLYKGYLIQALFAAACVVLAMVWIKKKEQEE